jgi:hypothetical protein
VLLPVPTWRSSRSQPTTTLWSWSAATMAESSNG